jgi:hypothetical protein
MFAPFSFPITLEQADIWEAADRYLDDACAPLDRCDDCFSLMA